MNRKIDTDNTVSFDENSPMERKLAPDYVKLQKGLDTRYAWERVSGRVGFAGSGTSIYRVQVEGVAQEVHIDRFANGRGFYGTTHLFQCVSVAAVQ